MVQTINKAFRTTLLLLLVTIVGGLVFPENSFAQRTKSRQQLEKERKENQKRLQETSKILEQVGKEKQESVGQLRALNQQVKNLSALLSSIDEELAHLLEEIEQLSKLEEAFNGELTQLKNEYKAMLYAASKTTKANKLTYLFAAKSVQDFFIRMRYITQYTEIRKQQLRRIEQVKSNLQIQQAKLLSKTIEQEQLKEEKLKENEKLVALLNEQNNLVTKLNKKENQLRKEQIEREKADRNLEKMISDLVRREMRRAAQLARAKRREKKVEENYDETEVEAKIELTPEGEALAGSFARNKARLNWPVEAGFISAPYGRHAHPVIKHIMIENLGIDIQTKENQPVYSVYEGEVGFVTVVPGMVGKIVTIMHGDYFTVYCKLKNVSVKAGDKVGMRDKLGEVETEPDGTTAMKFQIWKNNSHLNPQDWLLRR